MSHQHTLSIRPTNTPCQRASSTHPFNTPHQHTLITLPSHFSVSIKTHNFTIILYQYTLITLPSHYLTITHYHGSLTRSASADDVSSDVRYNPKMLLLSGPNMGGENDSRMTLLVLINTFPFPNNLTIHPITHPNNPLHQPTLSTQPNNPTSYRHYHPPYQRQARARCYAKPVSSPSSRKWAAKSLPTTAK